VGKYALQHIKPIVFAFFREALSGPILLLIAFVVEGVKPSMLTSDWRRFGLVGFVLYGNQLCYIMGLKLTDSATQTSIMQQCIPVFTSAMTVALKMEKFSPLKLLGTIFAVSGAVVMIGVEDLAFNNRTKGMIFLLGNTILTSIYYILQKPLLKKYPPITVTGWGYIPASVFMGFSSLYYVNDPSVYIIRTDVLGPLAYAVFVQTVFGYSCVSWANTHAPASLVAVYNSLQPVVTFILAYTFYKEVIVWNEGVGLVLVIAGLAFVTWARSKETNDGINKDNSNKNNNSNNITNKCADPTVASNSIGNYVNCNGHVSSDETRPLLCNSSINVESDG